MVQLNHRLSARKGSQLKSYVVVSLLFLLFSSQRISSQVIPVSSRSGPSGTSQATCTNNGTYVNSRGQIVKRPENCSSVPQGASAQCRDGSYSFSRSRRGTCSHHGGVARWL